MVHSPPILAICCSKLGLRPRPDCDYCYLIFCIYILTTYLPQYLGFRQVSITTTVICYLPQYLGFRQVSTTTTVISCITSLLSSPFSQPIPLPNIPPPILQFLKLFCLFVSRSCINNENYNMIAIRNVV